MGTMGCYVPLLWAIWAAMGHCYGHYGLLWATAIDMGCYGPLLWAAMGAMCTSAAMGLLTSFT